MLSAKKLIAVKIAAKKKSAHQKGAPDKTKLVPSKYKKHNPLLFNVAEIRRFIAYEKRKAANINE